MRGNQERMRFERLYDERSALVYGFMRQRLSSDQDAEDATVEVFRRVHRGLGGFRGDCSERVWVLRIASNVAVRFHERRAKRPTVSFEDLELDGRAFEPADGGRSENGVLDRHLVECLLASLQPVQRAAVWLRVALEYTDEETAEILDVPIGTVKSWVWRSMARLRKTWRNEFEESVEVSKA